MAVNCGVSFGVCAVRVTQLDDTGCVIDEANNSYVTDKTVTISRHPEHRGWQQLQPAQRLRMLARPLQGATTSSTGSSSPSRAARWSRR